MKLTAKTTETKRLKSISMTNPKLLSLAALLCAVQGFSQVTISGRVKNTTDSVIVFKKTLPHPILREVDSKQFRAKIEGNGLFQIELPEENISEWVAEFGNNQWQLFDLAKGQRLKIEADFSEPLPLKAIGKFADDFNYSSYWWVKMLTKYYHDSGYSQNLRTLSVDSILKLKIAEYKYAGQLLEEYRKSHILSDKYYQWLITKYRYIPYRLVSLDNTAKDDKEIFYNHLSRVRFDDDYAALNSYCYAVAVDVYLLITSSMAGFIQWV